MSTFFVTNGTPGMAGRGPWIPLKPKSGLNGAPTLCCPYIGNSVITTRQLSHPAPAANAGCPIQAVFWLEWDHGPRPDVVDPVLLISSLRQNSR
jgi:hypothetical protein